MQRLKSNSNRYQRQLNHANSDPQLSHSSHLQKSIVNIAQIISQKRDGHELTKQQIDWLIGSYSTGGIDDYQMSALAMAIFFRDMTLAETTNLTSAMIASGHPMSWPESDRPKLDKHSTGGIGDKISIPLAPLLAALGMDVPMISGRGLGPTGGTLDKLESIPGLNVNLPRERFAKVVQEIGCAIVSASEDFAPADKRLYALRDVTGTVASIPLITASILSKKLSEGLEGLVMDIKWGSGAFMKERSQAKALAERIVTVATSMGVPTKAILTDMNRPLGRMIGNACEILESIDILKGQGPWDVRKLTLHLAAQALIVLKLETSFDSAFEKAATTLDGGEPLETFYRMIEAQSGSLSDFDSEFRRTPLLSKTAGFVSGFDTEKFGYAIIQMGGGRQKQGDTLNYRCGIEMLTDIGERLEPGQPWLNFLNFQTPTLPIIELLESAIHISEMPGPKLPLITEVL